MKNIAVHRYENESVTKNWTGWIEDEDASWIIYLDQNGRPSLFWAEREKNGAVIGEPVSL